MPISWAVGINAFQNLIYLQAKKTPRVRFELTRPLRVTSYPGELTPGWRPTARRPRLRLGFFSFQGLAAFSAAAEASLSASFHALGYVLGCIITLSVRATMPVLEASISRLFISARAMP